MTRKARPDTLDEVRTRSVHTQRVASSYVFFGGSGEGDSSECQREALLLFIWNTQADVFNRYTACVFCGARPTAQTTIPAVQGVLAYSTATLPQLQRAAPCAYMGDRTVPICSVGDAIDGLTTPPPHHEFPHCGFCVLLCATQHYHCSSCAQHSTPTAAAGSVLCACGESALYSQCYSSIRCCLH